MKIITRAVVLAAATVTGLAPAAGAAAGQPTAGHPAAGHPTARQPAAGQASCTAGWRVATTIAVGEFPFGVGVDTGSDLIYTANSGAGTVSVINGQTRAVTATVTVGKGPYGVAVNSLTHTVYVTNNFSGTVSVINGKTNTVTATIKIGSQPYGVVADQTTGRIYVAGDNMVSVIDGQTNKVIATIPVPGGPFWAALDQQTGTLYVTDEASRDISVINTQTGQVTDTIDVHKAPSGIAVDPSANLVYAVVPTARLYVFNGRNNRVRNIIQPLGPDAFGVTADPATGQAFVADPNENSVSVVNIKAKTVATVPVGRQPFIGLAADAQRGVVYVTNDFGSSLSILVRCQPAG